MRRSTVILLTLFVLFAGLFWYMQQPGNQVSKAITPATSTSSPADTMLISPDKGPVSMISFLDSNGKAATLDKTSGKWILLPGKNGPLDQDKVEAAAFQALNLQVIKSLETTPEPAGMGLENPQVSMSFILADGSPNFFWVGKETVTGSGYYVKTFDGKVRIVKKSDMDVLLDLFNKPPLVLTETPPAP